MSYDNRTSTNTASNDMRVSIPSENSASTLDHLIAAALEEESLADLRQQHREECRRAFRRPERKERVVSRPRDRMPPREARVAARQRSSARR